jgi:adenosylcobinamide amidohydrolase
MQNVAVSNKKSDTIGLITFVTAGTSIAVTAGDNTASKPNSFEHKKCGTINIIVLIDGNLTESCMVDAVKTATEAKTVALRELDIRSRFSGDVASGTMTDSIAIACTRSGGAIKYAGTFTVLGELIGKAVRESVEIAVLKQEEIAPNRSLMKRLEERGISFEGIMSLADPKIRCENPRKYQRLKEQMLLALSDKNIVSLVLASLRFDDDARNGLIPENPKNKDVSRISIEEIFKSAMDNYCLSKKTGDSKRASFGKEKTAIDNLGPFTRSVLLAVLNQVCQTINSC